MKKYLFKRHLRRHPHQKVCFHPWTDIHAIAILSDVASIDHVTDHLQQNHKSYDVIPLPTRKQVSCLTGAPKRDYWKTIPQRHYDLLIDLCQTHTLEQQYVVATIEADLKIGRATGSKLYDLMIDTPAQSSADYLFEQMMKYLQVFQPKP